jgi:hypothetical protein
LFDAEENQYIQNNRDGQEVGISTF